MENSDFFWVWNWTAFTRTINVTVFLYHKIYNTQECIPVACVPSAVVAVGGGSLHQATVMAFWCGDLLVWWPSGVVAFWCGGLHPTKAIPEGHL